MNWSSERVYGCKNLVRLLFNKERMKVSAESFQSLFQSPIRGHTSSDPITFSKDSEIRKDFFLEQRLDDRKQFHKFHFCTGAIWSRTIQSFKWSPRTLNESVFRPGSQWKLIGISVTGDHPVDGQEVGQHQPSPLVNEPFFPKVMQLLSRDTIN